MRENLKGINAKFNLIKTGKHSRDWGQFWRQKSNLSGCRIILLYCNSLKQIISLRKVIVIRSADVEHTIIDRSGEVNQREI